MSEVVICSPLRTPVGRFGGVLRDVAPQELAATVIRTIMATSGLDGSCVDDVILGNCYPNAEAPAIGRVAALDAGLPVTVPGLQIDRRCGSGLQAVLLAAAMVETGLAQLVLAGGVESMSQGVYYSTAVRWGARAGDASFTDSLARGRVTAGGRFHPVPGGMLETAENLRRKYEIPRDEQDELAHESHRRAVAAQDRGAFEAELVPVPVRSKRGETVVDQDEHPRRDISRQALARLAPVMLADDPQATVTAGNASGQNDGAALCVVTTRARECPRT